MTEETTKELQNFQAVTNIRKITYDALAPVIKKIEGHMQSLIEQCQQLKSQGKDIKALIDMTNAITARTTVFEAKAASLEDTLAKMSNSHTEFATEVGTNREFVKMEMQDLRKELARREEKHNNLVKTQTTLQRRLEDSNVSIGGQISLVQKKLGQVYRDTLNTTLQIKSRYLDFDNKLDLITHESSNASTQFTETNKKMQLYMTERQQLYDKMEHLQLHIFNHVSQEQFEKYKKYQTVQLGATVDMMKAMLDAALSKQVRDYLPTVMESMKEINKIAGIQQRTEDLQTVLGNFDVKINSQFEQLKTSFSITVQEKVKEASRETSGMIDNLDARISEIESLLLQKIDVPTMDNYLTRASSTIYDALKRQQLLFDQKLSRFIELNRHHIYNAVESLIPESQKAFWNRLKETLPRIEQIQQDVQQQCSKVTSLASGLQETLERFSNRITKIKTDLELKDEQFATEIRYLKKSKEEGQRRMEIIGKLLSCQSEMIVLMGSLNINEFALRKKGGVEGRLNQVFVSFADGLIYELKGLADFDNITYRKKTVGKLDISCAALTCYLSVIDAHFQQEFLSWNKYRPSNFFKVNMQDQLEHERGKSALVRNCSSRGASTQPLQGNPVSLHQLVSTIAPSGHEPSMADHPHASSVLDSIVNMVEVKDDSMEIFARTTELRRRQFSRHKKLDQRYIKSGAQTTRLKSANRTNLG